MILPWMLYACATALFLGLAAASLETVVRERGWPVRGLWAAAMLGSSLVPFLAVYSLPPPTAPTSIARQSLGSGESLNSSAQITWDSAPAIPSGIGAFDPDLWLFGFWMAATTLLSLGFILSHAVLRRRQRSWCIREVNGRGVWVSHDLGPAVVGFFRSRIVLPEWLLERDETERALVLSHEEEHIRAGDPRLLFGALLLLAALPWNVVLWWQYRRLRQAVELDCDLRVLGLGLDPRAYSRLLVVVSEYGRPHRFATAAISESPSFLERRIRHMLNPRTRHWGRRALGATLLAGGLVLAACQIDSPDQTPIPGTGATFVIGADGSQRSAPTHASQREAMRLAIETRHPELLSVGVNGDTVYVWMLTNSRGEIEASVVETNPPRPVATSVEQLERLFPVEEWKDRWVTGLTMGGGIRGFQPGEIGPDRVVLVWWEHAVEGAPTGPFHFSVSWPEVDEKREAQRARIEQHHPGLLRSGLPEGEMLWFLLDENDQVVKTGRGLPATTNSEIRAWLDAQAPAGGIQRKLTGGNYRTYDHRYLKVVYATVQPSN
jgi:beta-lactamase regulating signal transducer with metallopeptidase domain